MELRNVSIATQPKTYEEAINSTKAKQWKQAMQAEVESIITLGHLLTDRETRMFYQENGYTESSTVQMVKWTSTV